MASVSALIGTLGLHVVGMIDSETVWPAFAKGGMGDLLGIIY